MGLSDAQLLKRIGRRDAEAFEVFLARHRAAIRRHLQRIMRDTDAADDLTQETFLQVWMHAEQWDGRGGCMGWLLRIATNLALNSLRARRRRREVPLDAPLSPHEAEEDNAPPSWLVDAIALGPEDYCLREERLRMLRNLIAALPDDKRAVVRLAHESEMDIHDIALHLGIPDGTVKSRLHYARNTLREAWRDLGMEEE